MPCRWTFLPFEFGSAPRPAHARTPTCALQRGEASKVATILEASQVVSATRLTVIDSVAASGLNATPAPREVFAHRFGQEGVSTLFVDSHVAMGGDMYLTQAAPEIARLLRRPQDWPQLQKHAYEMVVHQRQGHHHHLPDCFLRVARKYHQKWG